MKSKSKSNAANKLKREVEKSRKLSKTSTSLSASVHNNRAEVVVEKKAVFSQTTQSFDLFEAPIPGVFTGPMPSLLDQPESEYAPAAQRRGYGIFKTHNTHHIPQPDHDLYLFLYTPCTSTTQTTWPSTKARMTSSSTTKRRLMALSR